MSLDFDTLKFDQVVGMMQAYELQMKKKERSSGKSLALKAAEVSPSVSEDHVGLIVKRFFRKMERGQRRGNPSDRRPDMDRESKNPEKQCAECEGFGHYKSECPTLKKKGIRCYGCKGYGHTKDECVGNEEAKQKSYITWSESDSDDSEGGEGEILNSLVAQFGVIESGTEDIAQDGTLETVNQESESESDTDEQDISFEKFRILIEDLVLKKKDNEVLSI